MFKLMYKPLMYKSLAFVKINSLVAKLSLFCTAISTIATLYDTIQTEMGWAIDVVGVSVYMVVRGFSFYSYDKTQHIPPVKRRKYYAFVSSRVTSGGMTKSAE